MQNYLVIHLLFVNILHIEKSIKIINFQFLNLIKNFKKILESKKTAIPVVPVAISAA